MHYDDIVSEVNPPDLISVPLFCCFVGLFRLRPRPSCMSLTANRGLARYSMCECGCTLRFISCHTLCSLQRDLT